MDDKKKIVVVGALFVAMLAIGAFEFTKSGETPAPAKPKDAKQDEKSGSSAASDKGSSKGTDKDGTKKKDDAVKNPLVSLPLATRDPFKPIALPNPPPAPVSAAPAPKPVSGPSGSPRLTHLPPIPPMRVEGNPMPGELPPANAMGPNGPIGATSLGGAPVSTFAYKLKGTLMGDRPMAVFADSQGSERIVPVGSSLDGDSQVVSVQAGTVKVRVHGKIITMTPGGNE